MEPEPEPDDSLQNFLASLQADGTNTGDMASSNNTTPSNAASNSGGGTAGSSAAWPSGTSTGTGPASGTATHDGGGRRQRSKRGIRHSLCPSLLTRHHQM